MKNKYWCATHPTSYIGVDQFGNPYQHCWEGKKQWERGIRERCDIRNVEIEERKKDLLDLQLYEASL